MPVTMVRNTLPGLFVLSSDPKGSHYVEWQAANDPQGGDVQPAPEEIVGTPQFLRAVQRGILVLEEDNNDPAIVEALKRQVDSWKARSGENAAAETAVIDDKVEEPIFTATFPDEKGEGVL